MFIHAVFGVVLCAGPGADSGEGISSAFVPDTRAGGGIGEGVSNAFVLDTLDCAGPCGQGVSNAFVLDTRGNASHDWQLYR